MLERVLSVLVCLGISVVVRTTAMTCSDDLCYFVSESCNGIGGAQPASVHSPEQNRLARDEVVSSNGGRSTRIGGVAALEGDGLSLFWMDDSPFDYFPVGFTATDEGYIVMSEAGSWTTVPFSSPFVLSLRQLCSMPRAWTASSSPPSTTTSTAPPTPSSTVFPMTTMTTIVPQTNAETTSGAPPTTATTTLVPTLPANQSTSDVATTTAATRQNATTFFTTVAPNSTTNASLTTLAPSPTIPNATTTAGPGSSNATANTTISVSPNSTIATDWSNQNFTAVPNTTQAPNATMPPNNATSANTTLSPSQTNSSTVALNETTLAPNSTSITNFTLPPPSNATNTTTAPGRPDAMQILVNEMSSFFTEPSIVVTAYTSNAVDLFVARNVSEALSVFAALQHDALIGVVLGCDANVNWMVSALTFDPVSRAASFVVPPTALMTPPPGATSAMQWVQEYSMCVGLMTQDGQQYLSATKTKLVVQSLLYSLVSAGGSAPVVVREDDVNSKAPQLQRIPLFNAQSKSRDAFRTTRLSARAAANVQLGIAVGATLATGAACPSSSVAIVPSFVIGLEWGFRVEASVYQDLWRAQQGVLCAMTSTADTTTSIVVSRFSFESISAVTNSTTISSSETTTRLTIVTLSGLNPATVSSGGSVAAYASTNASCLSRNEAVITSLYAVQPDTQGTVRNWLAIVSTEPSMVLLSVRAAAGADTNAVASSFICFQTVGSSKPVRLNNAVTGSPVTITTEGSIEPPPQVVMVNGSRGSIALLDFVLPAQSASDVASVTNVMNALRAGMSIFLAAVDATSAMTMTRSEKHTLCQQSRASVIYSVSPGGILILNSTAALPSASIACSYTQVQSYLRLDFAVRQAPVVGPLRKSFFKSSDSVDAIDVTFLGIQEGLSVRFSSSSILGLCDASTVTQPSRVQLSPDGSQVFALIDSTMSVNGSLWRELCVGLSSVSGRTAMYAGTGVLARVVTFSTAWQLWQDQVGVTLPWRITSGAAMCGNSPRPYALPVENGVVLAPSDRWPTIFSSMQQALGSNAIQVSLGGRYEAAVFIEGRMYVFGDATLRNCVPLQPLQLTNDGVSFGLTSIATAKSPVLALPRSSLYTGLVVALTPAAENVNCSDVASAAQELIFSEMTHLGTSAIDLTPFVWSRAFQYYVGCARVGEGWVLLPQTVMLTSFMSGDVATSWLNQIDSGNVWDTSSRISLWQTQSVTWTVFGRFASLTANVSLVLVWDDPTCLSYSPATAALTTPVQLLDNRTGQAVFTVDSLTGSGNRLAPCYLADGSTYAWPLTLEAIFNRTIAVSPLSATEVNYARQVQLTSPAQQDVYVALTDSTHAPIAWLALYAASSPDDVSVTEGCSLHAEAFTDFVAIVGVDVFGVRWAKFPAELINGRAPSSGSTVFVMCASAATDITASTFQPVSIYVTVATGASSVTPYLSAVYLEVQFASQTDQVFRFSDAAVRQYLADKFLSIITNAVINVSFVSLSNVSGSGLIALWIPPSATDGNVVLANAALYQVYYAIGFGSWNNNVPLVLEDGSVWVVSAVTGRSLYNRSQISTASVRFGELRDAASTTSGMRSFLFFCAVVVPTTIGIVLYALSRPKPAITQTSNCGPTAGDTSPSPRKPFSVESFEATTEKIAEPMPLVVVPSHHDTVASPLYDSDEDDIHAAKSVPKVTSTAPPSRMESPAQVVNSAGSTPLPIPELPRGGSELSPTSAQYPSSFSPPNASLATNCPSSIVGESDVAMQQRVTEDSHQSTTLQRDRDPLLDDDDAEDEQEYTVADF